MVFPPVCRLMQIQLVCSTKGLENAHIIRPGYAIGAIILIRKICNIPSKPKSLKNLFLQGK